MSEWNRYSLEELAFYYNGMAFKPGDWKEDGVKIIRIEQLNNPTGYYDYFQGEIPEINEIRNEDLIFSWSATLKVAIWKHGYGVLNQHLFKVIPKEHIDKYFLYYLLDFNMDKLGESSHGLTMKHIKRGELAKYFVQIAEINEQRRIAQILSTCDAVIEKTQSAIAKYKVIKQGMLHDLFTRGVVSEKVKVKSEKGEWIVKETWKLRLRYEDAPELYKESKLGWIPREWEVKELGDIGEVRMCRRIFNFETSDQGDIPFFKIGTFGKQPDAYISEELYNSYRQRFSFPQKGDILISAAGTIGRTLIYNGAPSYYQDSNIVWIDNNENLISNKYLYQVFQIVEYKTEGGTIQRLYNSILKSALFPCPSKPEQRLITERLNSIDNKLQTEQSYLEKMKQLKKGLMEDLLSGKRRVEV